MKFNENQMNGLNLLKTEKKVTENVYIMSVFGQHYILHKSILTGI